MKKRENSVLTTKVEGPIITILVDDVAEEPLRLDTSAVSEAVRQRAVAHGLLQRIRDAAAIARDGATGKSASPRQKYEAMKVLVDHYASGSPDWSPARRETADTLLVRALAEVKGKSLETVREYLKGLTTAERKALENVPAVQERIAALSGASQIDAEELLAGL